MYRIFSAVTHSTGSIRVAVPQFLKFTSGRFFSESSAKTSDEVTMTEECAKHVIKLARKKNLSLDAIRLRIAVQSGGCSGLQYKFTMDYDKPYDYDTEFIDPSGARIVVDTVSLPYVKGSTVDWEDSLVRTGFVVSKNPNASESCSCGTSFTAKTINPYECIVCFQRCKRFFAVNPLR